MKEKDNKSESYIRNQSKDIVESDGDNNILTCSCVL